MKLQIFVFSSLLLLYSCQSRPVFYPSPIKSVLDNLDQDIKQKENYKKQKLQKIGYLKKEVSTLSSEEKEFSLNSRIIDEYLGFQCDSAFPFIDKNYEIARKHNNKSWIIQNRIQYATLLSSSGLFTEAKETLDSLVEAEIPSDQRFNYYASQERLYTNLVDYNGSPSRYTAIYQDRINLLYQKAADVIAANSPKLSLYRFRINMSHKQWSAAMHNIDAYLSQTEKGTQPRANGYACKALIYSNTGDDAAQMTNLALSACADLESATMENRSMQELAILMFEKGDIDRAYRYMQSALADANFYHARFRNLQISRSLPIIELAYQKKEQEKNKLLKTYIVLVSSLFLGLVIVALQFYRQKGKLGRARMEQSRLNSSINEMYMKQQELNKLLQAKNRELYGKNEQLTHMAGRLLHTNKIEETYLIKFLKMCSVYIHQLDEYRSMVYQKLVTGQVKDLQKFISSTLMQTERKELYRAFDTAFLELFPNFVNGINKLLQPEDRIEWKDNQKGLTSELRVFALIRLGIKDSAQISSFLGYTPSTTYTYRTKMKNKALIKETFAKDLMEIGQI